MFCPKCGTQNPENGKFCRSCGTDLSQVSEALTGKSNPRKQGFGMLDPVHPARILGEKGKPVTLENAFGKIFMGLAFLVVSIVLSFTPVGKNWWFWMLIPAFGMLGSGLAHYLQIKKLEQRSSLPPAPQTEKSAAPPAASAALPPTQNDYLSPVAETRYTTGDLLPPSVVEDTTRQLEINQEGETMTLPKPKQ